MEKKDLIWLAILLALMLAWPVIDRRVVKPLLFPEPPAAEAPAPTVAEGAAAPPAELAEKEEAAVEPQGPAKEAEEVAARGEPEQLFTLENERLAVVVSSRGAKVVEATLKQYRAALDPASGPVVLDFHALPALAYADWAGWGSESSFDVLEAGPKRLVLTRALASGGVARRTLELGEGYVLEIRDEVENRGEADLELPETFLSVGAMRNLASETTQRGMAFLGIDTLLPGGEGVRYWARKLPSLFEREARARREPKLPRTLRWRPFDGPLDWVAVKNKYFVQILRPQDGAEGCEFYAAREPAPQELSDPAYRPRMTALSEVGAWVRLAAARVPPREALQRRLFYYVGPKKYDELAALGYHQAAVMELGMWPWLKVALLRTLNGLYRVIPNYGVAIILLTILVRVVFWPITHQSTESMKRMTEIQPLVNEIRVKYKDNPQKQQQEIMALYKEHRVNPLSGCLPSLVQLPVFIGLFVVLSRAIELRFAPFLWVKDLSEPENLFAGKIPIVGSLNILPILMALTMYWQQKLTPSGGDPQQQKMMALMPLMMLLILYHFASGLALYWTTNQCLMIAQQLVQRRRQARARAASRPAGRPPP